MLEPIAAVTMKPTMLLPLTSTTTEVVPTEPPAIGECVFVMKQIYDFIS